MTGAAALHPSGVPARGWTLRARLLFLGALVVVPLLALTLSELARERQQALEMARRGVAHEARQVAAQYLALLERGKSLAAVVATLPVVRRGDWDEAGRTLSGIVHRFPEFPNLRVSGLDGEVLATARPGEPASSNAGRDWFEAAIASGEFAISAPFVGVTTKRLVTVIGYPVKDHDERPSAVVSVTIDVSYLDRLSARAVEEPRSTVTVVGPRGEVLSRYPRAHREGESILDEAFVREIRDGAPSGFLESPAIDGVPSLVSYERLSLSEASPPITVAVSRPTHVVLAPVVEHVAIVSTAAALLAALVVGTIVVGTRQLIAEPMQDLMRVKDRLAAGGLEARVPDRLMAERGEFGALGRSLAAMAERLREKEAVQAEAQARLRAILDSYDGFAALISLDYRVLEINAASLDRLDLAREDVVGRHVSTFGAEDPARLDRVIDRLRRAMSGEVIREEFLETFGPAGARILNVRLSPVRGRGGDIEHVAAFGIDVTDVRRAETLVREQAARMSLVFNSSNDLQLLMRADADLTIEAANAAFTEVLDRLPGPNVPPAGWARAEYLALRGFTPEQVEWHLEALHLARDQGRTSAYQVDVPVPTREGRLKLDVVVSASRDPEGRVTHVLWSARDISERLRTEEALVRSQQSLLEAQRLARIGSWEIDHVTGGRYWSTQVFRILELPTGRPPTFDAFMETVHPDDRAAVREARERAERLDEPYLITHRLLMPDGRVKFVESRAEIFRGADGTLLRSRGTTQDVTDRVRISEALRASEARLRQAELLAGLGHFSCVDDGADLEVSDGLRRLTGLDPATAPQLGDLLDRVHADDREACRQAWRLSWEDQGAFSATFRVVSPAGGVRTLQARGEFQQNLVDRRRHFVCTAIDVTDLKDAERRLEELNATLEQRVALRTRDLESSNRELESFSYSVSHDLRAPLRAIEGFTHAAIESEAARLSADGLALLRRVQAAAQRMGALIDALLRLSRMFREPLVTVPVDLSALARSITDDLVSANPARRPKVTIADGLVAVGDPRQLRVALTNLLDNAFKFSAHAAEPAVEFGARTMAGAQVFFVHDNGVGFDMANAGKLFQPFERMHSPLEFPGTGIGLATVQRVAQRHGGSVWAESRPGRGATFYLVLDAEGGDR